MAIKAGTFGTIKWDPLGVTPVLLISLNSWKLSLKINYEDVTCFGDVNLVYIPGLRDISGTLGGFWNSSNVGIFTASGTGVPGQLELAPNSTEPTFKFSGLAYLDADIDCSVKGAPKITSSFKAAGPWVEAP
jgi:hypothetical protein